MTLLTAIERTALAAHIATANAALENPNLTLNDEQKTSLTSQLETVSSALVAAVPVLSEAEKAVQIAALAAAHTGLMGAIAAIFGTSAIANQIETQLKFLAMRAEAKLGIVAAPVIPPVA